MIKQPITIKDIARSLGLSFSTVSRALKGSYKISDATQQLVKEYAAKHNYRPNLMAQSLKNKKSRCLGIALSSIPNNFYAEVISGIESAAYNKDYLVMITQNDESYEREVKNLENLSCRAVDGLLLSLSGGTADIGHIQRLHEHGLPIVLFDRVTDAINTHRVIADNKGGAFNATTHLLERGFRRIAHLTGAPGLSITRERLQGYLDALQAHQLPIHEHYIKYCNACGNDIPETEKAIRELLALDTPPDAILVGSDRLTMRCFSVLHEQGIHIPGQMALAGFSNFSSPELLSPSLTTIRQSAFEMGKIAAELLIDLIERKRPLSTFETRILPTHLCIRNSTATPLPVSGTAGTPGTSPLRSPGSGIYS
ncbi:LacI family DNA-binding transcriptional regulator [Chitinophaga sp. OAE865]|uniref:LacI family DNA-binding transcriptional regulator n=1 Tax=Chitinophaga sp. OAE865 TaxID=2817898 RepID=UPI001AE93102